MGSQKYLWFYYHCLYLQAPSSRQRIFQKTALMAIIMNPAITNTATPDHKKVQSYSKHADTSHKAYGKSWAAVSGTRVITLILIPTVTDEYVFNSFRDKSREALAVVGDVATGEVQMREGQKVFVKRLNRNLHVKGSAGERSEPIYTLPFYMQ